MKRVFLTGMSGVGKSTIITSIRRPDTRCIDLDDAGWMLFRASDREPLIDTARVSRWVAQNPDKHLIIAGCAVNQGELRGMMDTFVLLTASEEVMHARILTRTNNDFGKDAETWEKILEDKREIEPLLLKRADIVINTDQDIDSVVNEICRLL